MQTRNHAEICVWTTRNSQENIREEYSAIYFYWVPINTGLVPLKWCNENTDQDTMKNCIGYAE